MDLRQAPADKHRDNSESRSLVERTVVGLLSLLAGSVQTTLLVLWSPRQAARNLIRQPESCTPPFSFVIVGLLAAGLAIRLALLYFGRVVDISLLQQFDRFTRTVSFESLFVLTVPCVLLVAMVGAGVARWTRPEEQFQSNPVVWGVCYAAGFQCLLAAYVCVVGLVTKIIAGRREIVPSRYEDEVAILLLVTVGGLSATIMYHVVRECGTTRLAGSRPGTALLAITASVTTMIGILIVNSISFDLKSTLAEVRHRQHRENLGDVKVAVKTISQRVVVANHGRQLVEVTVAMVNVSDQAVAVPWPHKLEHAWEVSWPAIAVVDASVDRSDTAGWVIRPGDTQLATWTIVPPTWYDEARKHCGGLPVTLMCSPLTDIRAGSPEHPVGDPAPILTTLTVPRLEQATARNSQPARVIR